MTKDKKLDKKTTKIVKCPFCGAEYIPSEIYVKGEWLGKLSNMGVVKDPFGKIILADYTEEPEFLEHFECEYCHKQFKVETLLTFKTSPEEELLDFSNLETSLIDD